MPEASHTSLLRKVAIISLLLVLVAALAYDYLLARPAVSQMFDEIETRATANELISREELSSSLGKAASDTFTDGALSVDVYHFTSGLIVRPHKLFIAYEKVDGNWVFSRVSKFAYDESNSSE